MEPKPAHLAREYGAQFADPSVVAAYRHRPPYPDETIALLLELAAGRDALLDVGCGRGDLTIPMSVHFARVDAVDPSPGMLREARECAAAAGTNPAGGHVRWHEATLADADLHGPYDLVTAAESLHWTDWPVALPKLAHLLAPDGRLAIVYRCFGETPWGESLGALIARYSTNRAYRPYDPVEELERRGFFEREGVSETPPRELCNPREAYIEAMHSANGFSRDRMKPDAAAAFDRAIAALLDAHGVGEDVSFLWWTRVYFGRPKAPYSAP